MEKPVVKPLRVIAYAGAFVAFLIGSGFATGQEVLQYFTSYGLGGGLMVGLVCVLLFVFVGGCFIAAGKREHFEKGSDVYRYYCGKYIGTFYDYFSILFIFCSFVVMVGGAGATLQQHFGLPGWLGSVGLCILVCLNVIAGLKGVVEVIGKIGPIIAIFAIFLGIYSFLTNPGGVTVNSEALLAGQISVKQVGNSWLTSASSYVGFCMLWLAAFLAAMGRDINSVREGVIGTTLGGVGFTLGCVTMMLGLLAHLPEIAGSQIPALILAGKIGAWLATVFSVIIFAGIFTTAVPLLWQVTARFTVEGSNQFKIATLICSIVAIIIALYIPFDGLVNIIYGINGYVGIFLLVFIVIKEFRRKFLSKENA